MTPVSVMALVAIPLLSLLVTGHSILVIGMSITPLSVFDPSLLPTPSFWVRGRALLTFVLSRCAIVPVWRLPTYPVLLLDDSYCI
jgi:hypothetical protein